MGAKVCLILGILLLSHALIPTEATARAMLQTGEELKSDIDAGSVGYKPLKPGPPRSKGRGKPYTRRCTYRNRCRQKGGPPGRGGGPPGHV